MGYIISSTAYSMFSSKIICMVMKEWCEGEVNKKQPLKMVEVSEEDGELVFISCSEGCVLS